MNNKFSENLKKIRKDNNMSQEQLAEELGVSRQAISKWESAISYPEMDKIISLCTKFNIKMDDLLYKDIREIKEEEDVKKNINKFIDDILNFITNTINLFSNMNFKCKLKCLFEQLIISLILVCIFFLIGSIFGNISLGLLNFIPSNIYYIFRTIFKFIYSIISFFLFLIILIHVFKIRYLDYYEKIKKENFKEEKDNNLEKLEKNKKLFNRKEKEIIIRDSKHSEYKFINIFFKIIVVFFKIFVLCFSVILFITLIVLLICFVLSFLVIKTGIFYLGLLLLLISSSVINIILILILLNFVFNRKNNKKRMILSFIISLIGIGLGIGLVLISLLNFEYINQDINLLKTDYIELDMKDNLLIDIYSNVEYIESKNNNIKIEYTINKYCSIEYSNLDSLSYSNFHMYSYCNNSIKLIKEFLKEFNNKKIVSINNSIYSIKVYANKENIEILKNNYNNSIRIYNRIDEYIEKESNYINEINELKEEINELKNN